jgi:hypothetical protein
MSLSVAELKKPSDIRSIEGLAEVRANGRVLNLAAICRDLDGHFVDEAGAKTGFFNSRTLNRAIIVKHNVRENERYLLVRYKPVATKIILPIDPEDFSLGGASFMLNERTATQILRDKMGLHRKSEEPRVQRDLKLLDILDSLATLDPFIVRERMLVDGLKLPDAFNAFQIQGDGNLFSYMKTQLLPLVRMAMGSGAGAITDDRAMERLADEMFATGGGGGERADLLRQALKIPEPQWPSSLYTWKAALFYEYRVRNFEPRFRRFMDSVQKVKIYGFSMQAPAEIVLPMRYELVSRALRTKSKLDNLLTSFNQAYRKDLIGAGTPEAFREYLVSLQDKLYDFGVVNGVLEQMVGYWEYWFLSRGVTNVPADFFQSIARDLLTSAEPAGNVSAEPPKPALIIPPAPRTAPRPQTPFVREAAESVLI